MLCPKCNQPVADGARFCGSCGEPLNAGPAPSANTPAGALGLGAAAPGLIDRIKNIVLTPKTEWPMIASEPTTIPQLYKGYVIPLAAFATLMSFVRMSVIGIGFWRMPVLTGLVYALVGFVFALLGLYAVGWIIDMLAPTFSGQRDRRQALKTAAYAFTPGAIGAVFGLLGWLGTPLRLVAAIWGIYLLYLGLPVMMRSPREKAPAYTAAVIVCVILLFVLFGVIVSVVNPMRSYSPLGMNGTAMTREQRQAAASAAAGASSASPPAAADAPAGAANSQDGTAATAGVLAALSGAMAGNRHVDPVDVHTLKELLPDSLPGMRRTNAEAGTQAGLGMKASSATGDYQGDGATRAQIKIVDAAAVSGLLNLAGSMSASATSESDTGFEKDTTIGGRHVHEKYDNRSKHGELIAIVASRFTVSVTSDGVDVGTLEQYARLVDLSKLEAMKDAGVHAQQ
jgi:uncharacterized membrane protein